MEETFLNNDWKRGIDYDWVKCARCNTQVLVDEAMKDGCKKATCTPKVPYKLDPTNTPQTPSIHTFVRNPNGPPSEKTVLGVYNVAGDISRKNFYSENQSIPPPPKPPDATRLVCISDTHESFLKVVPEGDILIHAGDFTYKGKIEEIQKFNNWLGTLPHKHKIVIAGNHDLTFDVDYCNRKNIKVDAHDTKNLLTNCIYLQDSEVTVEGLRIYGSPWQPAFCDWAFNVKGDEAIKVKWDMIPTGIDVLVTHGPPKGHGGVCKSKIDAGCPELLKAIKRTKPVLHVAGHIHEGYGVSKEEETVFVNASSVNYRYNMTNNPIVVDLM